MVASAIDFQINKIEMEFLHANQMSEFSHRLGPSTDLTTPKFDFRFTPESGLKSDISPCPFGANIRSRQSIDQLAITIGAELRPKRKTTRSLH